MKIVGSAKRLTIYIGESDQWERKPLYQALLHKLKREGVAGATVTRGLAGFGAHSRIHTAALLRLSTDLPVVITVVDTPENIEHILPVVGPMVREGLMTVEDVEVVKYTHRYLPELPHEVPVSQVMSEDVAHVTADEPVAEVIKLLLERGVKAVPVVDDTNHVIGIITGGDLLRRGDVDLRLSLQQQLTPEELSHQLEDLWSSGKTAADVMTRDPITIHADTPVDEAGQLMIQHGIKRLPVVSAEDRLVGIVSRLDVLRTVASGVRLGAELPAETEASPAGARVAGDIVIRDVPTVDPGAPLVTVLDQLVSSKFRRVVVTDVEARVVGLITDAALLSEATSEARPGLLEILAARFPWSSKEPPSPRLDAETAADVMLTDVFSIQQDTALSEVLCEMVERGVKRLVVVDDEERLVGLVERQTLLQALLGEN